MSPPCGQRGGEPWTPVERIGAEDAQNLSSRGELPLPERPSRYPPTSKPSNCRNPFSGGAVLDKARLPQSMASLDILVGDPSRRRPDMGRRAHQPESDQPAAGGPA